MSNYKVFSSQQKTNALTILGLFLVLFLVSPIRAAISSNDSCIVYNKTNVVLSIEKPCPTDVCIETNLKTYIGAGESIKVYSHKSPDGISWHTHLKITIGSREPIYGPYGVDFSGFYAGGLRFYGSNEYDYEISSCKGNVEFYLYSAEPATYDIKAIENLKYNGSSQKIVSYNRLSNRYAPVLFRYKGPSASSFTSWSDYEPMGTVSGNYIVQWYSYGTVSASSPNQVEVTIGKATTYSSLTKPTAFSELVYIGEAQALCKPGKTNQGVIYYASTDSENPPEADSEEWSTDVPAKTDVGAYYIWYKIVGDSNHEDLSPTSIADTPVKIGKPFDDANIVVSDISSQTYSGSAICPAVSVTDGIEILTRGLDYSLECLDNKDVGTASIVITGIGNYVGKIVKPFDIVEAHLDGASIVASNIPAQTYSNSPICPEIGVWNGIKKLVFETDYIIECSNNVNAGIATAKIAGINNYTGEIIKQFEIMKAPLEIKANDKSIVYGESPSNAGVEYSGFVGDETNAALSGELSYEYTYRQFGDKGTYKIIPKGLVSDNYEITYVNGTLNVEPKEISIAWDGKVFTYNGMQQVPTALAQGVLEGDECSVFVDGAKIDVGEYTAVAATLSNDNYKLPNNMETLFSIIKAAPSVTAPSPVDELVYSGKSQSLILAGSTDVGVIEYSLDGVNYSTNIPTGINAGKYKVYYKIADSDNWNGLAPQMVNVSVATKEILIDWESSKFVYDGNNHLPKAFADGLADGDECVITVEGVGNDAGEYTAVATILSNANYRLPENTKYQFTIAKATPEVIAPDVIINLVYSGKFQKLALAGKTDYGTIEYSLDGEVYSTEVPSGKDAEQYTIYFKVDEGKNWNAVEPRIVNGFISPKKISIVWGETSFNYDGKEHVPSATATGLVGGDECSIVVSGAKINAGEYTAKAIALNNMNYELPQNVEKIFTISKSNEIYSINANVNQIPIITFSHNELQISNSTVSELKVLVFDVNGTLEKQYYANKSGFHHISLQHLNTGVHLIRISSDGNLYVRRFFVK